MDFIGTFGTFGNLRQAYKCTRDMRRMIACEGDCVVVRTLEYTLESDLLG